MVALNSFLGREVELLIDKSNEEFDKGNYLSSIKLLEEAWSKLPNPKGIFDESFHIVTYITETYLLVNDPKKAMEWAQQIFKCDLERIDSGEREFLMGKVHYETGNLQEAKRYFATADKKSEGRRFENEDKKYYKLLKG